MAEAMPIVVETSTGARALGIMCLKMILAKPNPSALAAITKSCSLKDRNSARTNRVVPIQLVSPMTAMMLYMLAGRRATTVRIRKKLGKQSMISTSLIIRVSIEKVFIPIKLTQNGLPSWPLFLPADTAIRIRTAAQLPMARPQKGCQYEIPAPPAIRQKIARCAAETR